MGTTPQQTQVSRIFAKFGGAKGLWRALQRAGTPYHWTTLYRWTYPRSKGGSNGIVPTAAQHDVKRAARLEGIALTPEDWAP